MIESPPFGPDGNEVMLFNGALSYPSEIGFLKTKRGEIPDFLRDLDLLLLVSTRAFNVISGFNIPSIKVIPSALYDAKGQLLADLRWLNITKIVPLLDKETSSFETSSNNNRVKRIMNFVVDETKIPDDDLFICDEGSMVIFTAPLVHAVRSANLKGAVFSSLCSTSWP
jgi:hypothetical protein